MNRILTIAIALLATCSTAYGGNWRSYVEETTPVSTDLLMMQQADDSSNNYITFGNVVSNYLDAIYQGYDANMILWPVAITAAEVSWLDGADGNLQAAIDLNTAKRTYPSADETKLGLIEDSATADQSNAEIKTAYEANADTNEFSDAEQTLLGNQSGANTGDQAAGDFQLDNLAAPDDNTDLNASTSVHGLLPKLDGVSTNCLNGTGAWSACGGGGSMTWPTVAGIPYWTSGTAWGGAYTLVTTIGTTGSDANIPSEQAVREAFSSVAFNMGGDLDNLLYDTGDTLKGNLHATKTSAYTIGTDDERECYGGVIYVTTAATITACDALDDRMSFTVIDASAAGVVVRVDPQGDDDVRLDGAAFTGTPGTDVYSTGTIGDVIHCSYYSADGWYCASGSPDGDHWTEGT